MPLTALPQSANLGRTTKTHIRNKENQVNAKLAGASVTTQLRRRRRAHPPVGSVQARATPNASGVAHSAARRAVRQGRRQQVAPYPSQPQATSASSPASETAPAPAVAPKTEAQEDLKQAPQAGAKITFPRFLPRYALPPIEVEAMTAIDPELKDVPIQYIQDEILVNMRPLLQRGLAACSESITKMGRQQALPTEITMLVKNFDGPIPVRLPTHILAVRATKGKEYSLFPIHDILFASSCAYLPHLHAQNPPTEVKRHGNGASTLTLPVVKFELENPSVFHMLYNYLYKRDVPELLAALLPPVKKELVEWVVKSTEMAASLGRLPDSKEEDEEEDELVSDDESMQSDEDMDEDQEEQSHASSASSPPPSAPLPDSSTQTPLSDAQSTPSQPISRPEQTPQQKANAAMLANVAHFLARTYTMPRLFQQAQLIQGIWSSVIMLGIADPCVWNAMDYAWSAVLRALSFAAEVKKRAEQGAAAAKTA